MWRGIVHVVDPMRAGWIAGGIGLLGKGAASDNAVLACAEAIRVRPGDAHIVVLLGTRAASQHAERLGLCVHVVVPAILGHAGLACRELRRVVIDLGGAAVLQPWSERARTACRLAAGGNGPIAQVPNEAWPSLGSVIGDNRDAVRASLGVPDGVPMVALLADPARLAEARRFVYMIGLLDVAGIPVAGLVDRRSSHVSRARRFHAEEGVDWRMLLPEEPTARLVHACDVGVIVPPSALPALRSDERAWVRWSVMRAHLQGVPVVGAEAWLPAQAWPTEGGEVLRARSASITDIARQLAKLVENRERLEALAKAVREGAERVVTQERYGNALDVLWENAAHLGEGSRLDVVLG